MDSLEALYNYMDKDQVRWMMMYRTVSPTASSKGRYFSRIKEYVEGAQSRVIFLLAHGPGEEFAQELYDENMLREWLQPQGPFHGVGEIRLYLPTFKTVTFSGPQMQTVFRVVNEIGGVVMIHPRDGPKRWFHPAS